MRRARGELETSVVNAAFSDSDGVIMVVLPNGILPCHGGWNRSTYDGNKMHNQIRQLYVMIGTGAPASGALSPWNSPYRAISTRNNGAPWRKDRQFN